MTEIADALQRAETSLAEARAALALARGQTVDALAEQVAAALEAASKLEAEADELDRGLAPLRAEVQKLLQRVEQ